MRVVTCSGCGLTFRAFANARCPDCKSNEVDREIRTDGGKDESVTDDYARRTDVCGVFCDEAPTVSFTDEWGINVHWCADCYDKDCGRCLDPIIDDANKRKGLCQNCRDEIRLWSGDEDRGVSKEPDTEQTTLLTDGGVRSDAPRWTPFEQSSSRTVCQNCDTKVTRQFARVFGDNSDVVHACPDCTTYREMQVGAAHDPEFDDGGDDDAEE